MWDGVTASTRAARSRGWTAAHLSLLVVGVSHSRPGPVSMFASVLLRPCVCRVKRSTRFIFTRPPPSTARTPRLQTGLHTAHSGLSGPCVSATLPRARTYDARQSPPSATTFKVKKCNLLSACFVEALAVPPERFFPFHSCAHHIAPGAIPKKPQTVNIPPPTTRSTLAPALDQVRARVTSRQEEGGRPPIPSFH